MSLLVLDEAAELEVEYPGSISCNELSYSWSFELLFEEDVCELLHFCIQIAHTMQGPFRMHILSLLAQCDNDMAEFRNSLSLMRNILTVKFKREGNTKTFGE